MTAATDEAVDALEKHAVAVLTVALPPETEYRRNPLPQEIAERIAANFALVGRKGIYQQILIVLADYHRHAWTKGRLSGEAARIALADQIMQGLGSTKRERRQARREPIHGPERKLVSVEDGVELLECGHKIPSPPRLNLKGVPRRRCPECLPKTVKADNG